MIPDVSVIIPVYNRADLLADCLNSLRRQTYRAYRTIVVDDASRDEIAATVFAAMPGADLVHREINGGFARAVNDGLRRVDTPLVFLLNSDMVLAPDCLERLVDGMREARASMACPLVLFRDAPGTIYSAGDTIRRGGRPESIGYGQPREGFAFNRSPFGVSAGAALYRREVFDTVGVFDEQFIAYFEDADLCMRARAAGFTAACIPEAVAHHVGSASLGGDTLFRTRRCYFNHARLVLKNYSPLQILLEAPWIFAERLHQARRLFSANRNRSGAAEAIAESFRAARAVAASAPGAVRARWRTRPANGRAPDRSDARGISAGL